MNGAAFAYTGRFAPSPTGALHAGSLVAALASWLDARAWGPDGGHWLVRIEDLDTRRCVAGAAGRILKQLQDCSLLPDEPPVFQSHRPALYQSALERLLSTGDAYPCGCSRRQVQEAQARLGVVRQRHAELVYPGTCRAGLQGNTALAVRFRVPADAAPVRWTDRRLGAQQQDVAKDVGDFVLRRADGPFSYQLAVVVDDHAQGITHVVRGADLTDNTARQLLLQRALGLPAPQYLHAPLVLAPDGQKLSKQTGALPLDTTQPLVVLNAAARTLGLPAQTGSVADALAAWVRHWRSLYNPAL